MDRWRAVAAAIALPPQRPDGLIEQFTGYFDRLDVPVTEWDENDMPRYPAGYHHFNCEDTQLLKQPDVLMALYLLPDVFDAATTRANFEYYEARTLHKSSLSPSIHAIMGIEVGDPSRAEQYFARSAFVDLTDNQGNTDEGMHIASAGGTWQVLVCGFGGFRVVHGQMSFRPWLPASWQAIHFRLRWRGSPAARHGRPRRRSPSTLDGDPDDAGAGARPSRRAGGGHHHGAARGGAGGLSYGSSSLVLVRRRCGRRSCPAAVPARPPPAAGP